MIIFLYGSDTYRSQQKLGEVIDHYKKVHQSGLNLKYFEEGVDFQDFKDELQQTPMFNEKKLIILKNIFSNQEFKSEFLKEAKKFLNLKDITLFYEKNSPSENDPFFRFLTQNAKYQEFKPLKGQKLKNWVKKEFGVSVERGVPEKLINWIGNDLWELSNQIKKLINYKKGKLVRLKDIDLLVRPKMETDIFKTIDALVAKNKKDALSFLRRHVEKGDNPLYLLSMINFQFRNLLLVKSGSNFKIHPYVLKKTKNQARKFSLEELKKIYRKLFETDLKIKTGQLDPEIALDLLIAEI